MLQPQGFKYTMIRRSFFTLSSRSDREFITSSRAKRACITWTASCLSQVQNSLGHKSLYKYMLGVRQWRHVALRHGAFCVSRQHRLRRWWPAHFMCYSWKAHVYSSMKQCLQSVNHEQFPIQMTKHTAVFMFKAAKHIYIFLRGMVLEK